MGLYLRPPSYALTWSSRFARIRDWLRGLRPQSEGPRGRLRGLREIHFKSRTPRYPVLLSLAELHETSLWVVRVPDYPEILNGEEIEGDVVFSRKTFRLKGNVNHLTSYGFRVDLEPCPGFGDAVRLYYQEDPSAEGWTETSPDLLRAEAEGDGHLFRHRDGREIHLVLGPKDGVLQCSFADGALYIDASQGEASRWGYAEPEQLREKPSHAAASLVNRPADPPQEFMAKVASSVLSLPHLTFKQRNEIGEMLLKGRPKWKV